MWSTSILEEDQQWLRISQLLRHPLMQWFNPFSLTWPGSSRVICPAASAVVAANPSTGVLWTIKPHPINYKSPVAIFHYFSQNTTSMQELTNCFQNVSNKYLTHFSYNHFLFCIISRHFSFLNWSIMTSGAMGRYSHNMRQITFLRGNFKNALNYWSRFSFDEWPWHLFVHFH